VTWHNDIVVLQFFAVVVILKVISYIGVQSRMRLSRLAVTSHHESSHRARGGKERHFSRRQTGWGGASEQTVKFRIDITILSRNFIRYRDTKNSHDSSPTSSISLDSRDTQCEGFRQDCSWQYDQYYYCISSLFLSLAWCWAQPVSGS